MTTQSLKRQIVPTLKKKGATKIALFGSFARGEENSKSDIDILAKFQRGISLFQLVALQSKLEEKLGRKVDLHTYGCIHPRLKKIILSEQKVIYEKRS